METKIFIPHHPFFTDATEAEPPIVLEWLVLPGDWLNEGDDIAEIETAKATILYPSPYQGRVVKILKPANEPIAPDAAICIVDVCEDEA